MNYNKLIDHTNLKPNASIEDIEKLCMEAKQYDFMSVCVNPSFIPLCVKLLKGSNVKVCTVIGFPLGATLKNVKVMETKEAIEEGADEVDMVINISQLKAGNDEYVYQEIKDIRNASKGHILKVILETCLLTDEEIVRASKLALKAGADFIKTSTGFSTGGATVEAVRLMRQTVGDACGVKASGGIRTHEDLVKMVEAGANRIGTSAGPKIL
ncbi:deoxyribose-phosphate aldolase [Coprobacillus sp. CAG:826]|jgi:deoxyribose-phosphate aldolase|nr:deoxyribose-phosphate aldolase [Coprobacillus sp.]CDD91250.1 deoxyribose-phosphate aldolase [Coprobacillus sp. CAG:826]